MMIVFDSLLPHNVARVILISHCCSVNKQAVQEYKQHRLTSTAESLSRDAVLITKEDLEGYHCFCDARKKLAIVNRATRTRPMIARLSCLFSSLKVSGGYTTITRQLTEARGC